MTPLAPPDGPARTAGLWVLATLTVTVVPIVVLAAVAPGSSVPALGVVLFVGASMHVASTAWFYSEREVREHMRAHRVRYLAAPAVLVAVAAVAAAVLTTRELTWVLLAFFAWQFHHFQKQNLGVVALTARANGVPGPGPRERAALVGTGVGGVLGLLGHPELLQLPDAHRWDWLFAAGLVVFCASAVAGLVMLFRRPAADRPVPVASTFVVALLFFTPVWVFASPYAAVAGLTIAHGLQYLILMGLLAGRPDGARNPTVSLLVLLNVALLIGLALNRMSHLHDGGAAERALFGVYLGLTATHFVVDAGLWRLRDEFPRRFLTQRLPYLLGTDARWAGQTVTSQSAS